MASTTMGETPMSPLISEVVTLEMPLFERMA
jgi:hypothetical protein